MLTPSAQKSLPLDPADDPALIKCEPYGLVDKSLRSSLVG